MSDKAKPTRTITIRRHRNAALWAQAERDDLARYVGIGGFRALRRARRSDSLRREIGG